MNMSDVGRSSDEIGEDMPNGGLDSGRGEFGHAVSRVAVAQLCESVGYHGARLSALDALSELAVRFVGDAGRVAIRHANLSGRTQCSVFDVAMALEEVSGACRGSSSVDGSGCTGLVDGIARYMAAAEDIPFAGSLPRFPVVCRGVRGVSFAGCGGVPPPGKHVPSWLPVFPDRHTYVHTPIWNERTSTPKEEKVEQARQRRKAERSLLNLQRRLAGVSNGAIAEIETLTTFVNVSTVSPEDREVLPSPPKDDAANDEGSSVLEVFRPAIEALSNGASDAGNNHALPSRNPAFRFGFNKKTLDTHIYIGVEGSRMANPWAVGADEKDDKKRRAQLIIKEAMDDPQELHQL